MTTVTTLAVCEHICLNHNLTDHSAVIQLVEAKFEKTKARMLALSLEMELLSKHATANSKGNAGLQKSATLLFDPDIDFYTVYNSLQAVTNSIAITRNLGFWHPSLTSQDTVSLLQDLLYGLSLH